jgi:hypothetical protein
LSTHAIVFGFESVPCTEMVASLHGRETIPHDQAAETLGQKLPKQAPPRSFKRG